MELVGKTIKSKINGNQFCVTELFTEDNREYYTLCDLACGKLFAIGKAFFEEFVMPNIEIID